MKIKEEWEKSLSNEPKIPALEAELSRYIRYTYKSKKLYKNSNKYSWIFYTGISVRYALRIDESFLDVLY
jgi:hypothetical protein